MLALSLTLGVVGAVATGAVSASACSPAAGFVGCAPDVGSELGPGEAILKALIPGTFEAGDGGEAVGGEVGSEADGSDEADVPDLRWDWSRCSVRFHGECTPPAADEEVPETPESDAPVVVTLRDIASFRPAPPGNGMEPGGWAVEGLPANFMAGASVQVVSGTLLGQPAEVRFTPVGYRWSHSDGGAIESAGPGASWRNLGQREFSETPTSHTYAVAGEYTVELSVVLRAEYRFAESEWRSIAGALTVAGEPRRVLVGEFDTVLTKGDCVANPSGPGC